MLPLVMGQLLRPDPQRLLAEIFTRPIRRASSVDLAFGHLVGARGIQDVPGRIDPVAVRVDAYQDSALLDLLRIELGFVLRHSEPEQAARQAACRRASA